MEEEMKSFSIDGEEEFVKEEEELEGDDSAILTYPDRKQLALNYLKTLLIYLYRRKLVIILWILVIIMGSFLTFCSYRLILGNDGNQYVRNTREYQIGDFKNMTDYIDRERMAQLWVDAVNNSSDYLNIDYSLGKKAIRGEYSVSVEKCNVDTYIRVREYIQGELAGTSTMDIKGNSKLHWRACVYPYWPALEYFPISSQKCEKDLHVCDHKYSRETRISLNTSTPLFNTCNDVFKYYPFAGCDNMDNAITANTPLYWWVYSYKGLVGTSAYEISLTLRYASSAAAITGNEKPTDAEWSVRISTMYNGQSEQWDDMFVDDIESTWQSLIDIFSETTCGIFG